MVYFERSKVKLSKWLSPVLLCYITGIIAGNFPFIDIYTPLSERISQISILIAIPMLLFSTDIIKWFRLAPKTVLAFVFVIISVMTSSIFFGLIAPNHFEDSWKLSGMLVGVYTGGTPNMSAIGIALDVKEDFFALVNAADVILGGIYLIFLLTIAKKLLCLFMPEFIANEKSHQLFKERDTRLDKGNYHEFILSLLYSICLSAICFGLMILITHSMNVPLLILMITSFSIGLSFISRIKENKANYPLGEYFILVFSLSIGTLVDIEQIISSGLQIVFYTGIVMFCSIILHFILCAIFRIDTDTTIITSVAGIYGPPFVAPIAKVLQNKEIIISGISTGLIGYAIGNYLGIALGLWLKP
ncbi:DUF819 family protein [candidate division KSB1 bacterium]